MSFASPWFLLGLLGIAIPIYLHLYHRKTPVVKNFPSLRLIRISVEMIARKQKMRNIILLILRIAAIIFVVMALSRPFWGSSASARASSDTPAAFVVLLDNSMSMGSTHQGVSVFSNAKDRALQIINQMESGDRATVGFLNDPGELVFSQLTWDKTALQRAVGNAQLTSRATNVASSLLPALKLLAPLTTYRRAIYVVTDMTKTAWEPFIERYDLENIDQNIDLIMVPVGGAAPENMAITSLTTDVPVVMTNQDILLKIQLANFSQRNRTARVAITIDGERKIEREFELNANSQQEFEITAQFNKAGMTHVKASIQSDALPQDDKRHLALRVFDPCKVLIIRNDSQANEDLFVRFALNPFNRSENNNFIVDSRTAFQASNLRISDYEAVLLLNQQQLDESLIKSLSEYLMSGGNIITFLGNHVRPQWYNENLIDNLGGSYILPARIHQRVGNAVSKSIAYQLTDVDTGHPALSIFKEEGSGDLSRAQIFEFFQVRPNSSALLLARMSRGLPAIIEEQRGAGKSMLITFPADTSWSTWPMRPTWVPFLHQSLISMITGSDLSIRSPRPGMPVSATLSTKDGENISLKLPDQTMTEIPTQAAGRGLIYFTTRDTDQTGYYELLSGSDQNTISAFTINPPPQESDLERMNIRDIPRFIPLQHNPAAGETIEQRVSRLRSGYDLSGISLLILILLALVECWFANIQPKKKVEYHA